MASYSATGAGGKDSWRYTQHENDGLTKYGGRDMLGYGNRAPAVKWPKGAKVALNFVINYEEGGESCILHGDDNSEKLLSEIVGCEAVEGGRNCNMESLYEYGSKSGFWRLHRLFLKRKIPVTVFAVGMALERNPVVCQALKEAQHDHKWEIASHGYRWIDYEGVDEEVEREHIERTIKIHERLIGKPPVGIYQGKPSANTRKIVVQEGGFKYDSDSYSDDLPYWTLDYEDRPHLVIPYTLTENDMKCVSPGGFPTGQEFVSYLKEHLKACIEEGKAGHPIIMTVGLHCRLARPGRVAALAEFMDFVRSYGSSVWTCTREQIADFWHENHYPRGGGSPMKADSAYAKAAAESGAQDQGDFI